MPTKKRYHQSMTDRHHESEGMHAYEAMRKRHEKKFGSGGYLTEDHSAVANLPQNVVYRPYGDPVGVLDQNIDDTIYGVDSQRMRDFRKASESWSPRKV